MGALPADWRIWTALTFGSLGNLLLDTHEDEIFRDHRLADGLGYFFKSATRLGSARLDLIHHALVSASSDPAGRQ